MYTSTAFKETMIALKAEIYLSSLPEQFDKYEDYISTLCTFSYYDKSTCKNCKRLV